MNSPDYPLEVSVTEASRLVKTHPMTTQLLDVREPYELAICRVAGAEAIPLRQIPAQVATLPRDQHLLILCHHGHRSLQATHFLRAQGFTAVSSIAGGIEAWAETVDPALARY